MASGSDDDIRFLTDVDLSGSWSINQVDQFPENPKVVTFVVKSGTLYGYIQVGELSAWCPFARIPTNFIFRQPYPAIEWTINHNLDTTDTWIQAKDQSGNPLVFGKSNIDSNSVKLRFLNPVAGAVLIMTQDIPRVYI